MDNESMDEIEARNILEGVLNKYKKYEYMCYVPKLNKDELSAIKYFVYKGENRNGKE